MPKTRHLFFSAVAKANANKKPTQVIVFMTPAEEAAMASVKLRFTEANAFDALAEIDRSLSAPGLQGTH